MFEDKIIHYKPTNFKVLRYSNHFQTQTDTPNKLLSEISIILQSNLLLWIRFKIYILWIIFMCCFVFLSQINNTHTVIYLEYRFGFENHWSIWVLLWELHEIFHGRVFITTVVIGLRSSESDSHLTHWFTTTWCRRRRHVLKPPHDRQPNKTTSVKHEKKETGHRSFRHYHHH